MADSKPDGSLRFGTGMDTSGFEAGSDKLLQSIQTLIDTVKSMGDSMQRSFEAMTPILQSMASTTAQIYAAITAGASQATQQQEASAAATQQQAAASQQAAQAAQQQARAQAQSGQVAQEAAQQAAQAAQQQAQAQQQAEQAAGEAAQRQVQAQQQIASGLEADAAAREKYFSEPLKSANKLQTDFAKLDAQLAKGFSNESAVLKFAADLEKARTEVDALREKMKSLPAGLITQDAADLRRSYQDADARLLSLYNQREKLESQGVKKNSSRWTTLEQQIAATTEEMNRYARMARQMKDTGSMYTKTSGTSEYQRLNTILQETASKLAQQSALINAEEIEQARVNAQVANEAYLRARGTEEEEAAMQRLIVARTKLNNLAAQIAGKKGASTSKQELQTVTELQAKLTQLHQKRKELWDAGKRDSDEYMALTEQIQEINNELAKTSPQIVKIRQDLEGWKAELEELEERGFGPGYEQYDKLVAKINKATASLKEYNNALAQSSSIGATDVLGAVFENSSGSTLGSLAMLAGPEAALIVNIVEKTMGVVIGLVKTAVSVIISAVKKLWSVVQSIASATGSAIAAYVQGAVTVMQKLGAAAASAAAGLIKIQATGLKWTFETLAKGAKSLLDKIKELATRAKKATPNVNALAKALTSFKRMLISRFKRMFITYVVQEIKDAFTALVKYSSEFDQSISGLRNTTSELAANIAASLEDVINAVAPILESFVSALSTAVTYISALFGMLAGKKTITVAKKQTGSYADSLRDTAEAADEAAGSLAAFDTLTTIDDGSGSKSGASAAANDGSDRFEEVPIDSILPEDIKDWFGELKVAFETQDWEGLGQALADKINEWIEKLKKLLEGDELKKKAKELADALAGILNGLFAGVHWYDLGTALAEGLNLLLDALNEFLKELDTGAWGRAAADLVNGFINALDWPLMGETLGTFLNRIVDFFWEFLTGTNWTLLGAGLAKAFNSMLHKVKWKPGLFA